MPSILTESGLNNFLRREVPVSGRLDLPDISQQISYASVNQEIKDRSIDRTKINFDLAYDATVSNDGAGTHTTLEGAIQDGAKNIFLKNGTYTLVANLTIAYNYCKITGESKWETIIAGNFKITASGDYFEMRNIRKSSAPTNDYMLTCSGSRPIVDNCTLYADTGGANTGVCSMTGYAPTFTNNICKATFNPGGGVNYLNVGSSASDASITDNEFLTYDDFYMALGGARTYFNNNTLNGDTGDTQWIEATALSCKITNNYFNDNGTAGAIIAVKISSAGTIITGNRFTETRLVLDGGANYVAGNRIEDTTGNAISITDGGVNKIIGNVITDCGGIGVDIDSGADSGTLVEGNSITGCTGVGIHNSDTATIIKGNYITTCAHGIFNDADSAVISNNICSSNSGDGIQIDGAAKDELVVSGNRCKSNTGYGINFDNNPTSTACVGNMLKSNTAGNLNGAAGTNSFFDDNVVA